MPLDLQLHQQWQEMAFVYADATFAPAVLDHLYEHYTNLIDSVLVEAIKTAAVDADLAGRAEVGVNAQVVKRVCRRVGLLVPRPQ